MQNLGESLFEALRPRTLTFSCMVARVWRTRTTTLALIVEARSEVTRFFQFQVLFYVLVFPVR